ncbi:hypothetical protein C84B14_08547 [Salinisphaera sp. C84B14]
MEKNFIVRPIQNAADTGKAVHKQWLSSAGPLGDDSAPLKAGAGCGRGLASADAAAFVLESGGPMAR